MPETQIKPTCADPAARYRRGIMQEFADLRRGVVYLPGPRPANAQQARWMLLADRLAGMGLDLAALDDVELAFLVSMAGRDATALSGFLSIVHRAASR
jgi:hypothetical protein